MKIVGINNDMYISSACLLNSGEIIAAGAEERFTRRKMTREFPSQAIKYCFKEGNILAEDVDAWAIAWNPGVYLKKYNPIFSGQRRHLIEQLYSVPDNVSQFYGRPDCEHFYQELSFSGQKAKIHYITHHRAHAANAFFLSPFDTAAIMTSDAQGEFESTTFSNGKGTSIQQLKSLNYPHSLGVLYSTITEFLGFRPNSDEWKVMAMGALTDQTGPYYHYFSDTLCQINPNNLFELDLSYFKGHIHEQPNLYTEKMIDLLGPPRLPEAPFEERHYQIAKALQIVSEEITFELLKQLYKLTKEKNLAVSGGFFMNSVLNGKILENTPFENIFISSCPDDSGNCFGAALYIHNHIQGNPRIEPMQHNYYGPAFSKQQIESTLKRFKVKYTKLNGNEAETAARHIAKGKIIGWFQGRMEFGQRALGNRSILADPRQKEMKAKINSAIKYRESFRPFAPAVLQESQDKYFSIGQAGDTPFMEKVYPGRPEKADIIPAVFHDDGTCRLQSVSKKNNDKFYNLIESFDKITGIPVVINTSFNLNGEPIVCTPEDALKTFFSCGLDVLIMDEFEITKNNIYGEK